MASQQQTNGKSDAGVNSVTVFFDYSCPFVYRATEWLYTLAEHADAPPSINWRYFSLAQVNYKARDGWKVWDAPRLDADWGEQNYARGLRFFWASAAAKAQGPDAFSRFHIALARAIHAERREFTSFAPLVDLAQEVGLDADQFRAGIEDQSLLQQLATDHAAAEEQEVFGVPTFAFADATPAYLKLGRLLESAEAVQFWGDYQQIVADRPYVVEIKRSQ